MLNFFRALAILAALAVLLSVAAQAQSTPPAPTGLVIDEIDQVGDRLDVDVGAAVQAALREVGILSTTRRSRTEGQATLRLVVDVDLVEKEDESNFNLDLNRYGRNNNRYIPEYRTRRRDVSYVIRVRLTGERFDGAGNLVATEIAEGLAAGKANDFVSTTVNGYDTETRGQPDAVKRLLQRQALEQAARGLASKLAGGQGERPSDVPVPQYSLPAPTGPSTLSIPSSDETGWVEAIGSFLTGDALRRANLWLDRGMEAPVYVGRVIRFKVVRREPNGLYRYRFDPRLRGCSNLRVEVPLPPGQ